MRPFFPLLSSIAFLIILVLFLRSLPYPPVIYNATDSLPHGFYLVRPGRVYHKGQLVVCEVPEHVRALVVSRQWLKEDGLFIKTIVGIPGDTARVRKGQFVVNETDYGPVHKYDSQGASCLRMFMMHVLLTVISLLHQGRNGVLIHDILDLFGRN